jgi:hypothetical protein
LGFFRQLLPFLEQRALLPAGCRQMTVVATNMSGSWQHISHITYHRLDLQIATRFII